MVGGSLIEWSWTTLQFALHSFAQMEDPGEASLDEQTETHSSFFS